jgi:hypothetical protein
MAPVFEAARGVVHLGVMFERLNELILELGFNRGFHVVAQPNNDNVFIEPAFLFGHHLAPHL